MRESKKIFAILYSTLNKIYKMGKPNMLIVSIDILLKKGVLNNIMIS
jgi:hypothetical protein